MSGPIILCFPLFTYLLFCFQMARHSHTAVEWMGNMVIFGGELANGLLASDVWMYRPLRDDWQQLGFSNSHGAPKLANHAAAVVDSYLYVFGGGSRFMFSPVFNLFFSWFCVHPNTDSLFLPRSHRGGHVFLVSVSVRPTRRWALGDRSAHWWKTPSHRWTLHGVPQPLQDAAGLRGTQTYHCQVDTSLDTVTHKASIKSQTCTDSGMCVSIF